MTASVTEEADWLWWGQQGVVGSAGCSVVFLFSSVESLEMVKFAKPVGDAKIDRAVQLELPSVYPQGNSKMTFCSVATESLGQPFLSSDSC